MTPTLTGRWQTRLFLIATVGLLMALLFGAQTDDVETPIAILVYLSLLGVALDVGYDYLQALSWDNDWSPLQHTIAGIIEGVLLWVIILGINTPPGIAEDIYITTYLQFYLLLWLGMSVMMWGPMKILFPHWRFSGNRLI